MPRRARKAAMSGALSSRRVTVTPDSESCVLRAARSDSLGTRRVQEPPSKSASTARLARRRDKPQKASAWLAAMGLTKEGEAISSRSSAGEPEGFRSTARVGPSRASRAFKDDFVIIHCLHRDPCDISQTVVPQRFGWSDHEEMAAAEIKHPVSFMNLAHQEDTRVGNVDRDRQDRRVGHVVDDVEAHLVPWPHKSYTRYAYQSRARATPHSPPAMPATGLRCR